jgi:hypothetical protein
VLSLGIFPNEAGDCPAHLRHLEQNVEWSLQRRYMPLKTLKASGDIELVSLPAVVD